MSFTKVAPYEPFEGAPKINLPSVFGASPEKPLLLRIPVTGKRPLDISACCLPDGLVLEDNIIGGSVAEEGHYQITLAAENELGRCEKKLTLEIKRDSVLLTPLMGFTSWNAYAFEVTQAQMEKTAELLVSTGLAEYGYSYVNTDSGWQGEYGGKYDAIMPNEKFPDIKAMCDRIHSYGFKCGIYSTPMLNAFGCAMTRIPLPPGCTRGEPDDRFADERGGIGVERKERNNALQWAEWGFDYLKYDWRPCDPYNAELMRSELVKTDRDFGFCVSVRARPEYHKYWTKYCSSYRNNPDSTGFWDRTMTIYESYFDFIDYINRGHYFDTDMLDIGYADLFTRLGYYNNPKCKYSDDEKLTVYTIRAFLGSPIQLSCDLEKLTDFELAVFGNEEMIAINQDTACAAPRLCIKIEEPGKKLHVFRRRLEDGSTAFCAFNLGESTMTDRLYLDEVSTVREVWAKTDVSVGDRIDFSLPPHCCKVWKTTAAASSDAE